MTYSEIIECMKSNGIIEVLTFLSAIFMLVTVILMIVQTIKSTQQSKIVKDNFIDINNIVKAISEEKRMKLFTNILAAAVDYENFVSQHAGYSIDLNEHSKYKEMLLVHIDIFLKYILVMENIPQNFKTNIIEYKQFIANTTDDLLLISPKENDGYKGILSIINFIDQININE